MSYNKGPYFMPIGDKPAKLTQDAKAAIQLVFEDLGGTSRLLEWANNPANLGVFYTQIWSKIIPKDVKAEVDGNIVIEIQRFGRDGEDTETIEYKEHNIIETVSSNITDAIVQDEIDEDE